LTACHERLNSIKGDAFTESNVLLGDNVDRTEIEDLFRSINVWKRGHQRAPHKPLLLLYALGKYSHGADRLIPYSDIDRDLRQLLIEFGPFRKSHHPEPPFWHLQSDGIWEIESLQGMQDLSLKVPSRKAFLESHAKGGFRTPVYEAVIADPYLIVSLATLLLEAHFPSTLHEDILGAVGIDTFTIATRKRRDSRFRNRVCPACLPSRKVERNLRYLPVGKQPVGKGVAGNGGV
jgi:putative restriction endonuclease